MVFSLQLLVISYYHTYSQSFKFKWVGIPLKCPYDQAHKSTKIELQEKIGLSDIYNNNHFILIITEILKIQRPPNSEIHPFLCLACNVQRFWFIKKYKIEF